MRRAPATVPPLGSPMRTPGPRAAPRARTTPRIAPTQWRGTAGAAASARRPTPAATPARHSRWRDPRCASSRCARPPGQRRYQREEQGKAQVLEQADGHGETAVGAVVLRLLGQLRDDDRRRGHRHRAADDDRDRGRDVEQRDRARAPRRRWSPAPARRRRRAPPSAWRPGAAARIPAPA